MSRLNLDMSADVTERMAWLCEQTDGNRSDVIRKGLRIYELMLRELGEGGEVVIRYPCGKEKVVLFV